MTQTQSVLSAKISLCQNLDTMSEYQLEKILAKIQQQLGCKHLRDFLKALLFMDANTIDYKILMQIQTYMLEIKENNNEQINISTLSIPDLLCSMLPDALIGKLSHFLTDEQVILLSQCNRHLYITTHQTSFFISRNMFTSQSSSQLVINNSLLKHMNDYLNHHKNGQLDHLFKYSKCHTLCLSITCGTDYLCYNATGKAYGDIEYNARMLENVNDEIAKYQEYFTNVFAKAPHWFTEMISQIKSLVVNRDGVVLMGKLPMNLLFNGKKSQLQKVEISETQVFSEDFNFINYIKEELNYGQDPDEARKEAIVAPFAEFDEKMSIVESKFPLKTVMYNMSGDFTGRMDYTSDNFDKQSGIRFPFFFNFKNAFEHLHLRNGCIHSHENELNKIFHPNLKTFTIESGIRFWEGFDYDEYCPKVPFTPMFESSLMINTLRIIEITSRYRWRQYLNDWYKFLWDKTIINAFNFDKSITKVLIHCSGFGGIWERVIQVLVNKTYFENLSNVVIMIDIELKDNNLDEWEKYQQKIFDMMEKNLAGLIQMHKYKTLKKFTFALRFYKRPMWMWSCQSYQSASIFEWPFANSYTYDAATILNRMKLQFNNVWQQRDVESGFNTDSLTKYNNLYHS